MNSIVNVNTLKPSRTDFLKLIAIIAMLIDHSAIMFQNWFLSPEAIQAMRIIGRATFPIMAYHIAVGYENTSDVYKYVLRLLIFAAISQLPYVLVGTSEYSRPFMHIYF